MSGGNAYQDYNRQVSPRQVGINDTTEAEQRYNRRQINYSNTIFVR